MRTFIAAKVHGLRVTDKSLHYNGSQTIPDSVMRAAGILPYEQVHCLNMSNGARWVTYAVPGPETVCSLNGAAARQGEVGDELILITYLSADAFRGAKVVFCEGAVAPMPAKSGKFGPKSALCSLQLAMF
jgi:aspartate 1-decarboxylase